MPADRVYEVPFPGTGNSARSIIGEAAGDGPGFKKEAAFEHALGFLRNRVGALMSLPPASIERAALTSKLQGISATEGTTGSSKGAA